MRTEGQGVKRRLSFPVRETEYFDLREGKIKMQGWGSDSQRSEALSSPCASHRMKGRSGCRQVHAFRFHDISMPLKVHVTIINACGCLACILSLILSFCLGRELWPLTLHGFLNLPSLGPLHRDPIGDCRVREGAWSSLGWPFLSCSLHLYVLS